jgi:thiamine pyrophosphokinase
MSHQVVGVLAGDRVNLAWLGQWIRQSTLTIAADGGADLIRKAGYQADVIVGDLDSVTEETKQLGKCIVEMPDQNFSDCEKLLQYITSQEIQSVTLCGLEGSRIDHTLHAIHSVARWPGTCLLAYENTLARIIRTGELITVQTRGTLSALPLESCRGVTMSGVRWPLNLVEMSPLGYESISNEAMGSATVSIREGTLLVSWSYDGCPNWHSAVVTKRIAELG